MNQSGFLQKGLNRAHDTPNEEVPFSRSLRLTLAEKASTTTVNSLIIQVKQKYE
jgi:hypothetical protein